MGIQVELISKNKEYIRVQLKQEFGTSVKIDFSMEPNPAMKMAKEILREMDSDYYNYRQRWEAMEEQLEEQINDLITNDLAKQVYQNILNKMKQLNEEYSLYWGC